MKPVRTQEDHDAALLQIQKLWGAKEGTARSDRLDVLITLVHAYEEQHHPIDPPDPIAAIEFRLEQMDVDAKYLTGIIGSRTRVYEVLRGDRPLTLNMIRRLNEKLGIPAEILIRPSKRARKRKAA